MLCNCKVIAEHQIVVVLKLSALDESLYMNKPSLVRDRRRELQALAATDNKHTFWEAYALAREGFRRKVIATFSLIRP